MNVPTYILIGGRSTRFGSPKVLAQISGQTLAGRAAMIAGQAFPEAKLTFIAASDEQFPAHLLPGRTIIDERAGFGPWSAIDTAISDADSDIIFVLACDLPFVSTELIRLLFAGIDDAQSFAAARQADGRIQPLCSFIEVKKGGHIIDHLISGNEKLPPLNSLFEGEDAFLLEFDDYRHLPGAEQLLMNINTPQDLSAAKECIRSETELDR